MAIKRFNTQKVDTSLKESHTIQVSYPNGTWNFKFKFGVFCELINQYLGMNGEVIEYYNPSQFSELIDTIDPKTFWPNEYERGIAKCRMFEVLECWKC